MKKMISKTARIRNLLSRVVNEDKKKQYDDAKDAVKAFKEESAKITNFNVEESDNSIVTRLNQYIAAADKLKEQILPLPVLSEGETDPSQEWYENLCKVAMHGNALKGKELKHLFVNLTFAFEKWISIELSIREI